MSLKAVDLQVMLPRIHEVGRMQQTQQLQEQAQQQSFATYLTREAETVQKTVQNLSQMQEGMIKEKEEEKGRSSPKKEGQKSGKKEMEAEEHFKGPQTMDIGQKVDFKV